MTSITCVVAITKNSSHTQSCFLTINNFPKKCILLGNIVIEIFSKIERVKIPSIL